MISFKSIQSVSIPSTNPISLTNFSGFSAPSVKIVTSFKPNLGFR